MARRDQVPRFLTLAHLARAALRACARRSSAETPFQRALPPILPPWLPQSRNRSAAVRVARWRFYTVTAGATWPGPVADDRGRTRARKGGALGDDQASSRNLRPAPDPRVPAGPRASRDGELRGDGQGSGETEPTTENLRSPPGAHRA
jgi:hypothetical protein